MNQICQDVFHHDANNFQWCYYCQYMKNHENHTNPLHNYLFQQHAFATLDLQFLQYRMIYKHF